MRAPPRPALELADIVREHGAEYRRCHVVSAEQHAVLSAIVRCRTAELGGHVDVCAACDHATPSYNSCRNRHCPKCQGLAQVKWIEGRMARVLPTHAFHVVFTLPAELRALGRSNRRRVFDLLFQAASATLLELGRDPKRLGAELGVTMVLHTWARDLTFHPHVHAIVTGGGLSFDGARWVRARGRYLFPVEVLGALFRGKLLASLNVHVRAGRLRLPADLEADPEGWDRLRGRLFRTRWNVYAKRPFGGPDQVIRYLGRYTHRVGIANQRLVAMDDRGVTFRTKNGKTISLEPDAFLARFLAHVLPRRFVKIRHFGLLAPSNATTKLEVARTLLEVATPRTLEAATAVAASGEDHVDAPFDVVLRQLASLPARCSACGATCLVRRALPDPHARAPPVTT